MKKRFSLRYKLILIFGVLLLLVSSIETLLAVQTPRKAVIEKIEAHLIDKAADTASIIDGRIKIFFQFLEDMAEMPKIRDQSISYQEKMQLLHTKAKSNTAIHELYITDSSGLVHNLDGTDVSYNTEQWFKTSIAGGTGVTEPYVDATIGNALVATCSVPVYDDHQAIIGVLGVDIDGLWFSEQIKDIVVGKTGYAYIDGITGTNVADPDPEVVRSKWNTIKHAQTDTSLQSLAAFEKKGLESMNTNVQKK